MLDREGLEQKLLADKSFQHILKFAPQSQRELMTFELAEYIATAIKQKLEALKGELPKAKQWQEAKSLEEHWGLTDSSIIRLQDNMGTYAYGFNQALAQITELIDRSIGEDE